MDELAEWQSGDASFILARNSLKAFYKLRESLMVEPTNGLLYSEEQKTEIWKSKNSFRKSLRNDVHLLFGVYAQSLVLNHATTHSRDR